MYRAPILMRQSRGRAVADSKYGTIDNFLTSYDRGINAHITSLEETQRGSGRQKDIFPKEDFVYNPDDDTFTCPAGNILKRRNYSKERQHYEYKASSKVCASCELRAECTRAKNGRSLKRHIRQDELDSILAIAHSQDAKRDLKTRMHLSERSFAQAARYGYKRARWRRLWRMEIQDFLIATVQNIQILIKHTKKSVTAAAKRQAVYPKTFCSIAVKHFELIFALLDEKIGNSRLCLSFLVS